MPYVTGYSVFYSRSSWILVLLRPNTHTCSVIVPWHVINTFSTMQYCVRQRALQVQWHVGDAWKNCDTTHSDHQCATNTKWRVHLIAFLTAFSTPDGTPHYSITFIETVPLKNHIWVGSLTSFSIIFIISYYKSLVNKKMGAMEKSWKLSTPAVVNLIFSLHGPSLFIRVSFRWCSPWSAKDDNIFSLPPPSAPLCHVEN